MNRALRTLALNAEYILTVKGKGSTARQGSVHAAAELAEALGLEGVEHIMTLQQTLEDMYTHAVTERVIAPGDPITLEFKFQGDGVGYTASVVTE